MELIVLTTLWDIQRTIVCHVADIATWQNIQEVMMNLLIGPLEFMIHQSEDWATQTDKASSEKFEHDWHARISHMIGEIRRMGIDLATGKHTPRPHKE